MNERPPNGALQLNSLPFGATDNGGASDLRKIADAMVRLADDLVQMAEIEDKAEKVEYLIDRLRTPPNGHAGSVPTKELIARARFIRDVRKQRNRCFGDLEFNDPAWEIMLALFVEGSESTPHKTTSLAALCEVPVTTLLRYLTALEEKGLLERRCSPTDKRVSWVVISKLGRLQMAKCLELGGPAE